MGDEGLERTCKAAGKTAVSKTGDVESDVNDAELRRIAAELRRRLTAAECVRLAEFLTVDARREGTA
ncbi:MAG: hypothetical protein ACE5KM_22485 [Planctomycetaceae bacterium]